MKRAMQYTGDNVQEIVENFKLDTESMLVRVTNKALQYEGTELMIGDWIIAKKSDNDMLPFEVGFLRNRTVQAILNRDEDWQPQTNKADENE